MCVALRPERELTAAACCLFSQPTEENTPSPLNFLCLNGDRASDIAAQRKDVNSKAGPQRLSLSWIHNDPVIGSG